MNWKNWMLVGVLFFGLIGCDKSGAEKGMDLFNSGDYKGAIKTLDAYLTDYPQDHQAFYNRGRAYEELKQYDKALADLRIASKADPTNVGYLMGMGLINYKKKKYDYVVSNMDAILEMNERNTEALVLKAKAFAYSGPDRVVKAMKTLEKAIRYDSNCGEAYYFRGIIRANARDVNTCNDLRKARELGVNKAGEAIKKYCN